MASKSKWIEIDSPKEPTTSVARRAIAARLQLVWHHLPLAAREADEDIEYVHQLRVATRRAVAAMKVFDEFLPPRRKRWFFKQLKRIRRAAGEARDDDVLGLRLLQQCPEDLAEACAGLRDRVRAHRLAAQEPIRKIHAQLADKGFKQRVVQLVAKVRVRDKKPRWEPTIACFARRRMTVVLEDFFIASLADFSSIDALHQFRIQGKALRYSMELFAGAFDREFREELYPQIEGLQERLGAINDRATGIRRFEHWLEETDQPDQRDFLQQLILHEQQELAELRAEFVSWWTPQQADALRSRFAHVLRLVDCDEDDR